MFIYCNAFIRRLYNKVYFAESKPGLYKRNARFKLNTKCQADIQNREIDLFGWKICDGLSEVIAENIKKSVGQNLFN